MNQPHFQILLLEDSPSDAYLFRMALTKAELNFQLTVVEDGADALSYIRQEGRYASSPLPDLAVFDLNVPKSGGLQVLQEVRKSERFALVPVVITTSSNSPIERAAAEGLGVERFLTKPMDLDAFLNIGIVLRDILIERENRRVG
jgi:CheY-like chemotaxis protein